MPLETATYTSQLVSSNPADTDNESQGSNHLRLIKAAIQATFPNFTAVALNSTQAAIDAAATAVAAGTGNKLAAGTAAAPSWALFSDATTGWFSTGAGHIDITVTGAQVADWSAVGLNLNTGKVIQINGVQVLPLPNAAVTYAMIQNVSNGALLGNFTGVAAAPSEVTLGPGLTVAGGALQVIVAAALPHVGSQVNDNLHILNDGTNATRDINATAGRVRDDSDVVNLELAATMVKRLDTAWAAGTNAGGCDSGSKGTSQTWHVFLIGALGVSPTTYSRSGSTLTIVCATPHGLGAGGSVRVLGLGLGVDGLMAISSATTNNIVVTTSGGGTIASTAWPSSAYCLGFDVVCSQNYAAPTLPSGWTTKQCLGSVMTDGSSNILAFKQVGDEFLWATAQSGTVTTVTSAGALTLLTPNGVQVNAFMRGGFVGGISTASTVTYQLFSSLDETDQTPAVANAQLQVDGGSTNYASNGSWVVRTSTSQTVRTRSNVGAILCNFSCYGWRDPRRRLF